jgi:hypothetical protein
LQEFAVKLLGLANLRSDTIAWIKLALDGTRMMWTLLLWGVDGPKQVVLAFIILTICKDFTISAE